MNKEEVLRAVAQADGDFVEEILTAAINRKRQLHPDWEIRYLALPRSAAGEERQRYECAWKVLTGEA